MAKGNGVGGQVKQVTDNDVDENAKVVGVEIFKSGRSGEEEIEELEDQQLEGSFVCEGGEKR